ncbi:uncharacterized protein [Gossypium hirsutum]|uniref:Uncharacterized protein n=1 Tax=Gossypium hirsutum TaxID=3635 RepID=A0A1U8MUV7_GOSHI|nr:uncharacterized protein LOC107940404 [Gossypium hirsutum]
MSVTEYEREFVRLSKYAREFVSTEAIMCKRFEVGLNEDIRLLVSILELKEFIVLVERTCKAEELDESASLPIVVTSMTTQKCVRKGYEAYLAFVLNTKESELKIESVPVVYEYPDVFSEELPRLPPIKEVNFGIELIPGTAPISIAPYMMAPIELKELKVQL